jgi:polysaccharide export outer membrane protein
MSQSLSVHGYKTRSVAFLAIAVLAALVPLRVTAGQKAGDGTVVQKNSESAVVSSAIAEFTLGADDVIEVSVENHADLNRTMTVLSDGTVTVPPIGKLKAVGKTPAALASEIETGLERTYNNCPVLVSVKEVHSRHVRILGAIRGAGAFDLKPGMRLMDLIAAAGGFTVSADLITARLVRGGITVLPISVVKAFAQPESAANIPLEVDDLVLLDVKQGQVFVYGQVARPGAFDLAGGQSVLAVLSQAGNPTENAALTKAYIIRNGAQIPVNLRALLIEGKDEGKVLTTTLQPGDALFIPEALHYSVNGQVSKPGIYSLPEFKPLRVTEALNIAGGTTQFGNITDVVILRKTNGKVSPIHINVDKLFKMGDLTGDVVLQANDIVFVPSKKEARGTGWQDVFGPLSILNLLFHL